MKSGSELYNEHLQRLKDAVAMKKTDRPPIFLNADAFCIRMAGGKLSDLVHNLIYGKELTIKGIKMLGDIDSILGIDVYPPKMGTFFLSDIKVPGRDLPDNILWQIDEKGLMTVEDYDTILKKGWNAFFIDFVNTRLRGGFKETEFFLQHADQISKMFTDAGIVALTGEVGAGAPYDALAAGRGISKLMMDLHRIPDKVQAVIDVMQAESEEHLRKQIRESKAFAVFTGGARAGGDFLSYKAFDRFFWPYFKRCIEIIAEENAIAYLHMDMNWDRFLDYFKELPIGTCIFSTDSSTDIFKAKEILYGHVCFTGDVSPSLLTLGTPDQVYAYTKKLINAFPSGFIMSTGCMLPFNAKIENVKAMFSAVFEG